MRNINIPLLNVDRGTKQLAISSPRVIKCISINQNLNNLRNIFKVAHVWNIRDWMPGNRVMRCYQLPTSIVPHFSFYLSFPSVIPNNQIWLLPTSTSIYVQLYVHTNEKETVGTTIHHTSAYFSRSNQF